MRIVHKYLLKELGGPFLASLFITTLILAAGNIIQTADMVINKGVEFIHVVKIFLFFLPYVLIFTVPISVLAAVLLGFGRLSGDNEVTTLRTSGISIYAVILPIIASGMIISLFSVPLNDRLLPQAEFEARKLVKTVGIKHPAALLEPGIFVRGFRDYILFIHSVRGNKLEDIRIYQPRDNEPTRVIVAEKGEIISMPEQDSVKLKLEDGTADEIKPDKPDEFYKLSFREYYMILNLKNAIDVNSIQKKAREKSIAELNEEIERLEADDINVIPLRIEIHKKIALAFSSLVFVLAGIPLAITTHRREKFVGFGLAIVLFLLYWGIMLSGIAFAIRGLIPAWAGVWSANIVLTVLGLFSFHRLSGK